MRLAYDVSGEGEPLLLLHGLGSERGTWDGVLSSLEARFQVIRADLKGFGDSPKPLDGAYSIADQLDCVRELMETLGLESTTLIGNSLGGAVCLLLAARHPEFVRRLVLLSAPADSRDVPKALSLARLRPTQWLLQHTPAKALLPFILPRVYANRSVLTPERRDAIRKPLDQAGTRHAIIQTALRSAPNDVDALGVRLEEVSVPTLLIWGEKDRIIPLRVGRKFLRAMPHAELVVFPGCGHAPQEERPQETATAILRFLTAEEATRS